VFYDVRFCKHKHCVYDYRIIHIFYGVLLLLLIYIIYSFIGKIIP